jgi:hypothetical protein
MLTINRLLVRGKIPRRSNVDRTLIDRIVRDEFAVECSRQLNRPWPVQARVARIRQLRVRVSIPASQLRPDTLVKAWTAAFLRELFAALAHLRSVEIVQFQSRAEYVAAAIKDLLNGVSGQRWAYEEFERLFEVGTAEAVLTLLTREHAEIVPILFILEDWGLLDQLLALWNEAGLEQFFIVIAGESGVQAKRPSIEELIVVARLVLEHHFGEIEPAGGPSPAEGRIALKLSIDSARPSDRRTARLISPRTIYQAVRILRALLGLFRSAEHRLRSLTDSGGPAGDSVLSGSIFPGSTVDIRNLTVAAGGENQNGFIELLDKLRLIAGANTQEKLLIELRDIIAAGNIENQTAFAEIFNELVTASGAGGGLDRAAKSKWISTDCVGLFLLIRVLDKLGWEDRLAQSSLSATYGPRLLTYTLAGVSSAILGRFNEEPAYVEAGVALFSGWMDAPDLRGFRAFLASGSVETRRDLLQGLLGQERAAQYSADWLTCFDSLANYLIQEFTEQIRCFGKPSRSFVVKNFVTLPGRIGMEEKRLVVSFTSSPLYVVIHLSGLDDPIEAISWLGGRRIEFQSDGF